LHQWIDPSVWGLDSTAPITVWCTFCASDEAGGMMGIEIAPGEFDEFPICDKCLERAQSSSSQWLDTPE
jgi:hypothetical protein